MYYIICWYSLLTGALGRESHHRTWDVAQAWLEHLDKECPDLCHWIEPV